MPGPVSSSDIVLIVQLAKVMRGVGEVISAPCGRTCSSWARTPMRNTGHCLTQERIAPTGITGGSEAALPRRRGQAKQNNEQ
jgi:hypothetical protein